jgi:hypothetical protein
LKTIIKGYYLDEVAEASVVTGLRVLVNVHDTVHERMRRGRGRVERERRRVVENGEVLVRVTNSVEPGKRKKKNNIKFSYP